MHGELLNSNTGKTKRLRGKIITSMRLCSHQPRTVQLNQTMEGSTHWCSSFGLISVRNFRVQRNWTVQTEQPDHLKGGSLRLLANELLSKYYPHQSQKASYLHFLCWLLEKSVRCG